MDSSSTLRPLRVSGLFAGIGGIELGLGRAGHQTELLCEIDPAARRVLASRLEGRIVHDDIRTLEALPDSDLVVAGFPCQDLSQAGRTAGIQGSESGLVEEIFRLLDLADPPPRWLLLENVSFMLSLDRGAAMAWLTQQLDVRGYTWAYRVVDSRAFSLPQRRQRVLLLASRVADPRPPLLNQSAEVADRESHGGELACGFYWTEGLRGLGWAVDAIPTLKGGSTIGIPSPPAIWMPGSEKIATPEIRDAERLQGFEAEWTAAADQQNGRGSRTNRWKLVGNAVSVPVAQWIGERLQSNEPYDDSQDSELGRAARWPRAAWGKQGTRHAVDVSMWPIHPDQVHLHEFLEYPMKPLSARATAGFLSRTRRGNLRIPKDFLTEAEAHLKSMTRQQQLITV